MLGRSQTFEVESIGGYRIVRRLGAGTRAEVFLGHAGSGGDVPGGVAAIKLLRPGADQRAIDEEIEVLSRGDSRHLLRLEDVATTQDGRQCLVVPRLGGSVARLLAERPALAPGEVVTILAPLAKAISELHDAGCCHGAVAPGAVLFDEEGAPVLARFGHAFTFGAGGFSAVEHASESRMPGASPAERSAEPRVAEDLRQLRALGGILLARSEPGRGSRAVDAFLDWLDAPERDAETGTFARDLSERLFGLAEPVPVALPGILSRSVAGQHAISARTRTIPGPVAVTAVPSRQKEAGPHYGEAMHALWSRIRALPGRVGVALATVRRSFLVAGGAGLIALVLAVVMLPSAGAGNTAPSPSGSPIPAPRPTPNKQSAAVDADDPVAALRPLLLTRDRCLAARSITCLDDADQRGSSSWENDSHLIRALQQGGAPSDDTTLADETFVLTERLGDSALLTTQPAAGGTARSILVMKDESGWRIRDFLPR